MLIIIAFVFSRSILNSLSGYFSPPDSITLQFAIASANSSSSIYCKSLDGVELNASTLFSLKNSASDIGFTVCSLLAKTRVRPLQSDSMVSFSDISKLIVVTEPYA